MMTLISGEQDLTTKINEKAYKRGLFNYRVWLDTAWFGWYNYVRIQLHKFGVGNSKLNSIPLGIH